VDAYFVAVVVEVDRSTSISVTVFEKKDVLYLVSVVVSVYSSVKVGSMYVTMKVEVLGRVTVGWLVSHLIGTEVEVTTIRVGFRVRVVDVVVGSDLTSLGASLVLQTTLDSVERVDVKVFFAQTSAGSRVKAA